MNNDLISKSALLELAHNHVGGTVDCNDIARFPAVDAEVVRHGRWMKIQRPGSKCWCSECKSAAPFGAEHNYCPNCGAKMDAEVEG